MTSNIIFAVSILLVMYFLPVLILKGMRGEAVHWPTLLPFALGAMGMTLFFCGIY